MISSDSASFWPKLLDRVTKANYIQSDPDNESHHLKLILQREFLSDSVRIYPFGSRVMGVGQEGSDLDIYVEIGNSIHDFSVRTTASVHARQIRIANAIKSNTNWKFIASYGGFCPIVKAIHEPTSLQYDISFSNGIAYFQNKLVKYIFELQPIARYMVIYLRGWIENCNLKEQFRSHIIILMVIYFLQVSNFLPGIQKFQENLLPTIGPWVTTFNQLKLSQFMMTQIHVNEEQTRKMLLKFFEYYSTFDFANFAICPYLGYEVRRSTLSSILPKNFTNLKSRRDAAFIQDFIYLNSNKGWQLEPFYLKTFTAFCKKENVLM